MAAVMTPAAQRSRLVRKVRRGDTVTFGDLGELEFVANAGRGMVARWSPPKAAEAMVRTLLPGVQWSLPRVGIEIIVQEGTGTELRLVLSADRRIAIQHLRARA